MNGCWWKEPRRKREARIRRWHVSQPQQRWWKKKKTPTKMVGGKEDTNKDGGGKEDPNKDGGGKKTPTKMVGDNSVYLTPAPRGETRREEKSR